MSYDGVEKRQTRDLDKRITAIEIYLKIAIGIAVFMPPFVTMVYTIFGEK